MLTEDTTVFDILQMMPSGIQRGTGKRDFKKEMKDMPDMILEQAAVSYAKGMHIKDLGMDVDQTAVSLSVYYGR